jgi:hypothetical protein
MCKQLVPFVPFVLIPDILTNVFYRVIEVVEVPECRMKDSGELGTKEGRLVMRR